MNIYICVYMRKKMRHTERTGRAGGAEKCKEKRGRDREGENIVGASSPATCDGVEIAFLSRGLPWRARTEATDVATRVASVAASRGS